MQLEFCCGSEKVSRMVEKVCKDHQMLVDIFVNYDCDLEALNLFERMNISRDAKCRSNMAVASQTTSIKGSSLLCLVNVLKSLVDWEKSCGESDRIKTFSLWKEMLQLKSVDVKSRQDATINFEKAKAHKSTVESAIFEVE
ncbi:brefeldin A-inhibited guanine nucleotide-exchange protein 5-like isoform X1 [Rosa rugosa]|uniref:brefeldin A-inhibited guanine nucleotide-exchange protein 5-like isoform X1 n=1 Tax=Rosa rugosa TaxID=74645 RepID=UPI002B4067EB|nr:brefeldin A-inhibited guanine nucleotide-exchange protein 5-like isoform X1 [Rosa rugosa]